MNKYIYIIVLFCLGGTLAAQQPTLKQYLAEADEAFAAGNFHGAMVNYNQALMLKKDDASIWNRYGAAAMEQNAFKASEKAYSMVVDSLNGDYADAYYNLATSKMMLGKYDEATTYYNLYTSQYSGEDPTKTKLANLGKKSAKWSLNQDAENEAYSIEKMNGGVNTGYAEFGPTLLDDQLHFASLRFDGAEKYSCQFSKVMKNRDVANTALKSNEAFNIDNRLTGASAFSPDGSMLYYSLCDYEFAGDIICDLYSAKVEDGIVGDGQKLGGDINGDGYTSTMPSISSDGTLYFASNRPGGSGGLDIYSAKIDGRDVGAVTAMSDINTAGDDGTPFISDDGTLYFASNGRIGFGGYDIYMTDGKEITNLGSEINTSYNDLYFIVNSENSEGYLTSNRPGSMYLDDAFETCCYDLYKVNVESCTVDLLALVRDCSADEDLNGATLTVTNNSTGEEVFNDTKAGSHKYMPEFDCDNAYTITATKAGYSSASVNIGPYTGKRGIQKVEETLCLVPMRLDVSTFTDNCSKPAPANVTLYNVTKGTQETCSSDNECGFDLECDTQYKLVTSKAGYTSDVQEFNTNNCSGSVIKKACLVKSAPPCSSMLPIRLYFDNDYPDPTKRTKETALAYGELFDDYYSQKNTYIRKYGGNYGGKTRETVQGELGSFFDNEVLGGYNNMKRFLDCLIGQLQAGQTVNIFLRGYASPLASDAYNELLTNRRVLNVRNEIRRYKGGILAEYVNNGQLKITDRAFGEGNAPSGISDSAADRRKSVYSPEASRERRVEIDEIKFNN